MVSLGNDTPEMVSAKMLKTYQLYLNAKDGDAIEFGKKKFIKGKHGKVGDFLLKKIMTTYVKDKRRRERMKSRGQGMNLVDASQERITLQVVGDGMMPALLPAENLVNVVGDGIVEGRPACGDTTGQQLRLTRGSTFRESVDFPDG